MMPFTRPDVGVGCCQAKRGIMWLKHVFGTIFVTVSFKFLIGYINRYSKQCVPVYKLEKSLRMTQSHLRKKEHVIWVVNFNCSSPACQNARYMHLRAMRRSYFSTNRIDMAREPKKNVCHSEGCSC